LRGVASQHLAACWKAPLNADLLMAGRAEATAA
jgi:hypothetical protein